MDDLAVLLMPPRKRPPNDEVIALYRSGLSCGEIAERCNVKPVTVDSLLRRIGEPLRSVAEAAAVRVAAGRTNQARYWLGKKQSPEHVESRVSKIRGENHYMWKDGSSDQRQYRRVVTKDACAHCGETARLAIHHVNNDHYDNALDNLLVLCVSCHSSLHKKAYWDAIHAGQEPPRSNAPIGWRRGGDAK